MESSTTSRNILFPNAAPFVLGGLGALALGLAIAANPALAVAIAGAAIATIVYAWLASRIGLTLALLLPAALAALLLPANASKVAEAALLLAAIVFTVSAFRRRDPAAWGAVATLAIVAGWTLLLLNPNVPDISTGLIGLRKTTFMFIGLAIGLAWPKGTSKDAEWLITRMLCTAGLAVLAVHIFFPELEESFVRGASVYTEEFAGQARVSGFFSGPFHVSLLGSFLVLWAWHAYLTKAESRLFVAVSVLTGVSLLVFADVRTGYVTVGLGVILTLLLSPGVQQSRVKVVGLTAFLAVAVALLFSSSLVSNQAISSIPHLGSDSRVASRVETLHVSEEMIGESPVIGWGPGSAGSTLESAFFLRRHVTSHNQVFGFLVEGGFVGLLLVVVALWVALRSTRGLRSLAHPAAAAAIALIGFGISGDVSEALPISLFLLILVGLRARPDARSYASAHG